MTCCSTESSFLERRCSAITLGLSSRGSSRRPSRDMWEVEAGNPGIHIIEPTPKSSPCPSERQTHAAGAGKDHIKMLDHFKRKRNDDNSIESITEYPDENNHQYRSDTNELSDNVVNSSSNTPQCKTLVSSDTISHQPVIRRAPLASLSSFKMSSVECQDSDANGSSVLDESLADTDDDMEQFSTDSDEISLQSPPTTDIHRPKASPKADSNVNGKTESSLDKNCDVVIVNVDKKDEGPGITGERKRVHSPNVFSCGALADSFERQRSNDKLSTRPASNSGCHSSASDKKSTSSECVTINVVDHKIDENSSHKQSAPSAVILEMPVLVTQPNENPEEAAIEPPDPAVSSRKWSKETLF